MHAILTLLCGAVFTAVIAVFSPSLSLTRGIEWFCYFETNISNKHPFLTKKPKIVISYFSISSIKNEICIISDLKIM